MNNRKLRIESLEPRAMLHGQSSAEYALDEQYDLRSDNGNEWFNNGGLNEKWMIAANLSPGWVFIEPDGDLRHWEGDGNIAADPLITTLPLIDYDDISRLYDGFHEHGGGGGGPHEDDPEKQAEHEAVMALVADEDATHTAVQTGAWGLGATWGGSVPTETSRVIIPESITVTVTGEHAEAEWVRVDGKLDFSTTVDTALTVETIIVTPTGEIENHSTAKSRIIFADSGAIDTEYDPFLFSRGLISHGITDIDGVDKTDWTTFTPTAANASTITVASSSGWQVGDTLTVAGAAVEWFNYQYHLVNKVEEHTIASISGNVITLSAALTYPHAAVEDQDPVVQNLTRNITFSSENTATDRRGHVMLMHSDTHSVKDAAFKDLGRTDKLENVTDPDGEGNGLENPRGRYSLHFHRTGGSNAASVASGVSIVGSPGWGIVNHDSNVNVDSSVTYNVVGTHFMSETAADVGSFTNNAAVLSVGTADNIANKRGNQDFGHSGSGFWFEGSDIVTDGNVATNHSGPAFTFFLDGDDIFVPFEMTDNTVLHSVTSLFVWAFAFTTDSPSQPFAHVDGNLLQGAVALGYPNFVEFNGNTIIANEEGFDTYGVQHTGVNANMRYIDNTIKGFQVGLLTPTEGLHNLVQGGYYDNLGTNILVQNTYATRPRELDMNDLTFGNRATWDIEMQIGFFTYNLLPAYPMPGWGYTGVSDWEVLFEASALGEFSTVRLDGEELYFAEQAKDFAFGELLTRFPNEIRYEPNSSVFATGESLNARNLFVGGVALPAGVQYHLPKVRGVFVE